MSKDYSKQPPSKGAEAVLGAILGIGLVFFLGMLAVALL